MSQQTQIGRHKTTIYHDGTHQCVKYHNTKVVRFNDDEIILNTGGWFTATTKTRMNQAASQFNLGFKVYQKNYEWVIEFRDTVIHWGRGRTDKITSHKHNTMKKCTRDMAFG